jgi:hypothetical protein
MKPENRLNNFANSLLYSIHHLPDVNIVLSIINATFLNYRIDELL